MMSEDDNVTVLPGVRRKPEGPDQALKAVGRRKCNHQRFTVDEAAAEVECRDCGERLNPMWVLTQIAKKDSALYRYRDELLWKVREENKKMARRHNFKCGSCGKVNDISKPLRVRALS